MLLKNAGWRAHAAIDCVWVRHDEGFYIHDWIESASFVADPRRHWVEASEYCSEVFVFPVEDELIHQVTHKIECLK